MNKKGFTILEIIVVVSVIAILLGVALPRLKGMQEEAKITQVKSELKTLQAAVEAYKIHQGSYPNVDNPPDWETSYLITATPKIIDSELLDPFTQGAEYRYVNHGNYYVIWSVGAGDGSSTLLFSNDGAVTNAGDNICVTNGSGC
ncbi:MAG: type II secretion system protein GspG [Candidatus Omnitrophica bacterium]|nr:type II secretion system protein GspG [Candidatus Omnitrophota bacterium]